MFDIDASVTESEVWRAPASIILGEVKLVHRFVLVGDSVQEQPVYDLELLEAFDLVPAERTQLIPLDVIEVLVTCLEVPLTSIGPEELEEHPYHRARESRGRS